MNAIVVIGASAGGLTPLLRIIAGLPVNCPASVFVVEHIGRRPSHLPLLLGRAGSLPAAFATDGATIEAGHIYVAPPDRHMILAPRRIRLTRMSKVHFTRPAIDPLFVSAAEVYGKRVIGIILSGGNSDGAMGLQAVREHGGTALVQDPEDAAMPSMPLAAIAAVHSVICLPIQEMVEFVAAVCVREGTHPSGFHS